MNWLIIEDALKDHSGHWEEFVTTFRDGLTALGDHVQILGPCDAIPDIIKTTGMKAALPISFWRKDNCSEGALFKVTSIAKWVHRSISTIRHEVRNDVPDVIFVPTVGIPHLIVWFILIKLYLPLRCQVLLYFMATPVKRSGNGEGYEILGLGGRLFFRMLRGLSAQSRRGRLVLATETSALSQALSSVSGAKFHTLPQPVNRMFATDSTVSPAPLIVGAYGPARHEKGSDILVSSIEAYLASTTRSDVVFAIQWLDDFQKPDGKWVKIPDHLKRDPRFLKIGYLFAPGEYATWLAKTSLMLLPYGPEYALRGSRVIIEAMIHGIPVVVAAGTTLERHGRDFGSTICCKQNTLDLTGAIELAISNYDILRRRARELEVSASEYFSVRYFRNLLLEGFDASVN